MSTTDQHDPPVGTSQHPPPPPPPPPIKDDSGMYDDILTPSFIKILSQPTVQNLFIAGCGGGMDFVHSMAIYPTLMALGKNVVLGSYSFGAPENIVGGSVVFSVETPDGICIAKLVSGECEGAQRYCPEVALCRYLDQEYPTHPKPHQIYSYYARKFSVNLLKRLYKQIIKQHNIDTIILIDGGSDSLMKGDESGLGDPIEDSVSVTTVSLLNHQHGIHTKLLLTFGLGMDRFNGVSDYDSLAAIAELTTARGFLGAISLEPDGTAFLFYKRCINFINSSQEFRSVLSAGLVASVEGGFGYQIPNEVTSRVRKDALFLWPLMGFIWGFSVDAVAKRSLVSKWIQSAEYYVQCNTALTRERKALHEAGLIKPILNLPSQAEVMQSRFGNPATNKRDVFINKTNQNRMHIEYQLLQKLVWGLAGVLLGVAGWVGIERIASYSQKHH